MRAWNDFPASCGAHWSANSRACVSKASALWNSKSFGCGHDARDYSQDIRHGRREISELLLEYCYVLDLHHEDVVKAGPFDLAEAVEQLAGPGEVAIVHGDDDVPILHGQATLA